MHPRRRPRATGHRARPRHAAPRRSLPARLAARAVIGVLVPLLGVSWLVASHDVTLTVDGRPQQITTHARTVAELLDRVGIEHDEHDQLVPSPSTPLQDGMVVELVNAREITLLVEGQRNTVMVTALSVDDVIEQLAARRDVTRRSLVRPSRLTPVHAGMTVEVVNPVAVTVLADGKSREVVTDAPTVGGVLQRLDIKLRRHDRVEPSESTPVASGMRIAVERVRAKQQRRIVTVPFQTEERRNASLASGERREIQSGSNGRARVTERVIFVNGVEDSRERTSYRVISRPRTRIVEVGTAPRPRPKSAPVARSRPAPDPAPTRTAQPPASEPSGDADSTSGRSQTGEASYYHHPDEGMTAAHRSLPFGTVVTVTNLANGKSVRVTINDRGPYVEGRIIDLNEPAFEQIAAKATGVIDVRITW